MRARRKEIGLGRIKTRQIGSFGMYVAALLINSSLRELLPFVNQKLEIRTAPELVQAMVGHDLVPIE